MAYYDVRTGKRVTNPVLFWIYVTILGICLLRVDSGRVWGAIILVLCFFAWVNIIKEGIKKNKSNTQNAPKTPQTQNAGKSSSAAMMTDHELDRLYEGIYNATPNNGSLDQLMKLFGNETFRQKVCTNNEFCRMIFHEHISRDLLGYIYEHNKPAAYLICYDIVKAVTQKRN